METIIAIVSTWLGPFFILGSFFSYIAADIFPPRPTVPPQEIGAFAPSSRRSPADYLTSATTTLTSNPTGTSALLLAPQAASSTSPSGKAAKRGLISSHGAVPASAPLGTTPVSSAALPALASRPIVGKSVVGLLCYFKSNDPRLGGTLAAKGSGVVVSPEGYILTARHVVDTQWEHWAYATSTDTVDPIIEAIFKTITLDYCEVGLPSTDDLPSTSDILSLNPSLALQNPFPYVATLAFEPTQGDMSDNEYRNLDFAVLKITRPMDDCATFNACTLPSSYEYSSVLYDSPPDTSSTNQLVTFGYPAEAINSSDSTFHDFYLKGAVGSFLRYKHGDAHFKDKMFNFDWSAGDVIPGRSGSPIFWQGRVIGIAYTAEPENRTIDQGVGIPAIYQILEENGLGGVLSEK